MISCRPAIAIAALLAGAGVACASSQASAPVLRAIEAEGTQFKVTLSDGRVLHSNELVGATLVISMGGSGTRRIRIDGVETDPGAPQRGVAPSPEIFLHTLSVETADGSWQNICNPGPDGRRQAFPLAGRAPGDGTIRPAEQGAFEITCTGGAQGKCVRFGYRPWETAADGTSGFDLYNTCVRMVRADYAGDGKGTTRDGQPIDPYDRFGIQRPDDVPSMELEAGWNKDGAVCVRHVRVKENVTLAALERVPRLRGRTGDICTEEFARKHGAVIFNRSPR